MADNIYFSAFSKYTAAMMQERAVSLPSYINVGLGSVTVNLSALAVNWACVLIGRHVQICCCGDLVLQINISALQKHAVWVRLKAMFIHSEEVSKCY
jgi:hypothetical protein